MEICSAISYNLTMEEVKLAVHHKCPGLLIQTMVILDDSTTSHTAAGTVELVGSVSASPPNFDWLFKITFLEDGHFDTDVDVDMKCIVGC
jgi:hypothetical protein